MSEPQLATLRELQDGTYTLSDLADMHEALDLREECFRLKRDKK